MATQTRAPAGNGARPSPRQELFARALIWMHVLGILASAVLWVMFRRGPERLTWFELVFALFNVPVSGSLVSIVLLAITARLLVGRKRAGLGLVAFFQGMAALVGVAVVTAVTIFPEDLPIGADIWSWRFLVGPGVDILASVLGVVLLGGCWWARRSFPGRLRRGSWLALATCVGVGVLLAVAAAWAGVRLTYPAEPAWPLVRAVFAHQLGFAGPPSTHGVHIPGWIGQVASTVLAVALVAGALLFSRSAQNPTRWTADRELAVRGLLARYGDLDSLGYFSTRRDKASVFSPDGRAVVCYDVIAGVSLASGDPVGAPDAWPEAIAAWKGEARHYGWVPAVLGAGEQAARAYAAADFDVLALGDEAILEPDHYRINSVSMSDVRRAAARASAAGLEVRLRRQVDIDPDELAAIVCAAADWRTGETERGFSMALDRHGDPADERTVYATAHGADGELVGLLTFVPWGSRGLSLDLMRRAPTAPHGTNELLVSEVMARAGDLGIRRVSLNFAFLRGVFADAERLGAGMLTRFNSSVLGVFDRFFQLERLYRANQKFEPTWVSRYLCIDSRVSIPQVAVACGMAEGFLPRPPRPDLRRRTPMLDAEHLRRVREVEAVPVVDVAALAPTRGDQTRVRLHHLAQLDALPQRDGLRPYAVGSHDAIGVADLTPALWEEQEEHGESERELAISGRVRSVRNHGGVVFVTLVEREAQAQLVFERHALGERLAELVRLVDRGDLLLARVRPGSSRNGTRSLLARDWQVLAKALHPLPFDSFTDSDARLRRRSTDLIVHPEQARLLRLRSAVVTSLRRTLDEAGYLEVETPILHTVHGGASARPFTTFINAYGVDLSLRIAPELYLKRLVVAGLGPLYEIGRNFRNEGADATHNPEFTSLEAYEPFGDYTTMRLLTQRLVQDAAASVHGRQALPLRLPEELREAAARGERVSAPPETEPRLVDIRGDWPVVTVLDAVSAAVGRPVRLDDDFEELLSLARRHGVDIEPHMGPGAVVEELYGELVEPATVYPTFYVDFPVETSPLAGGHRRDPQLAERWDLVVGGMELGTAYSELTDPLEQRRRLTEQSLRAAAGDVEAMEVDEDFLAALEIGMPPTGGLGIGVDRLVMVLTGTNIRQVLTFPFVRPRGRGAR